MKLSAKLFLEHNGNSFLGPGKVALLRAVDDLGSLRQAALSYGMSYRWAWGKLNDAEGLLGFKLLSHSENTSGGSPKELTPEAYALMDWYEGVEKELRAVLKKAGETMPECLKIPEHSPTPDKLAQRQAEHRSKP
jgi:N-terminal domain of molybdenum-binding protein